MATDDETTKNTSNDWAFVSDHIQGSDADSDGNFLDDTMIGFSKHGTLALTFHANYNSGIVCAKCFQFMKPGSYAIHCNRCDKDPAPSAKAIKEWSDSDKKWAGLKREFPEEFSLKTEIRTATRDGVSAYVVHPRFYLGKTSSTMKLRALCITNGCVHVCAFNALHRHFKKAHMRASYAVYRLDVLEAPTVNDVEDSSANDEEDSEEAEAVADTENMGEEEEEDGEEDSEEAEAVADTENKGEEEEEDGMGEENNAGGTVAVMEEEGDNKEEERATEADTPGEYESGEAVDSQDADCEPFVKEDGPSDDDTTEENLENKGGQDKGGKTKPDGKQNNPEPVRKSARKRRAPTRY
jgi:hypothetical protein